MLVTALTGFALVTSAGRAVLQHLLCHSSASPGLSVGSSQSPGMAAAAAALPAPPALSPGAFFAVSCSQQGGIAAGQPWGL